MAEGIDRWPCIPRVSGLIPGASNLKKLFTWMKVHGLTQISKDFVQMAELLEQTLGENECWSAPSPRSFPGHNLPM